MNNMKKILIVEDDDAIAAIEKAYLKKAGFEADILSDGVSGRDAALSGEYALVLLDIMLPRLDGFTACQQIRERSDIPILLVTALGEDTDKIKGLGMGADDYIEKPFSPKVLVARVQARIARYEQLKKPREAKEEKPVVAAGDIVIDTRSRIVTAAGKEIPLANKEYELLLFLARHPGMVFSREDLYEEVWGWSAMGDTATVAVHVNRLREKLEAAGAKQRITTVRGAGYRLEG